MCLVLAGWKWKSRVSVVFRDTAEMVTHYHRHYHLLRMNILAPYVTELSRMDLVQAQLSRAGFFFSSRRITRDPHSTSLILWAKKKKKMEKKELSS